MVRFTLFGNFLFPRVFGIRRIRLSCRLRDTMRQRNCGLAELMAKPRLRPIQDLRVLNNFRADVNGDCPGS